MTNERDFILYVLCFRSHASQTGQYNEKWTHSLDAICKHVFVCITYLLRVNSLDQFTLRLCTHKTLNLGLRQASSKRHEKRKQRYGTALVASALSLHIAFASEPPNSSLILTSFKGISLRNETRKAVSCKLNLGSIDGRSFQGLKSAQRNSLFLHGSI